MRPRDCSHSSFDTDLLLPRWLRTSLDEHPSTPFLLSPPLVNTSASALEAREKFRRSLVCRAVALAEARHGSSRIRWKFHLVRCFKSRNRKFSNRILDSTFVRSIPFFREIQTMSRDKFFWFLCLFEIRSIWKLIREVFLFFFLRNQSFKFQSQNLESFFFLYINLIYQSIQIMKKQDYLCHFVYFATSQFIIIIVFLSKSLIKMRHQRIKRYLNLYSS